MAAGEELEAQLRTHAHRLQLQKLVPTWLTLLTERFGNYANPFPPSAPIYFTLEYCDVDCEVDQVLGDEVRTT